MNKFYPIIIVLASIFLMTNVVFSKVQAKLVYEKEYVGAFKGKIEATGLKANHEYVLTINGYPKHSSNKKLIETCELYEPTGEGYCDFDQVSTDSSGVLSVDIEEELPKGKYRVKFLIKDPAANWVVVWSKDIVRFEVIEESKQKKEK